MAKQGIYISPTEFVAFSDPKPAMSLSAEIATRKNYIDFYTLNLYLPNPDTVLKKLGKDIRVYTDLLADGRVWSGFTSYKAGITSLPGSLYEAMVAFSKSKLVKETLGDHIFNKFIENKKVEWDLFRTHVSQFEIDRYLPML